jgi:hypothetical protein
LLIAVLFCCYLHLRCPFLYLTIWFDGLMIPLVSPFLVPHDGQNTKALCNSLPQEQQYIFLKIKHYVNLWTNANSDCQTTRVLRVVMGDTIEKVSKSSILTKVSILSILAKSINNSIPLEPAMFLVSIAEQSLNTSWRKQTKGSWRQKMLTWCCS